MKRFIFISIGIFVSLLSNETYAQLHLGVKAGANLTRIDSQSFNDKFDLGYQLGGFLRYDVSQYVGLQTEVLFNQTNTEIADDFTDVVDNAFDKGKTLNYISVPVLLRINTNGFLSLTAGPQFSILANKDKSVVENGRRIFKDSDFAALVGAELKFSPFVIYARYSWGFSDISNIGGDATSQQIQLGVAVTLF